MRISNLLVFFMLSTLLLSCGNGKDLNKSFSIVVDKPVESLKNGESLSISLKPKGDAVLDSVVYQLDNTRIGSQPGLDAISYTLNEQKLGKKQLQATLYAGDKTAVLTETITLLASETPVLYTYEIVNTFPHDTQSYTQGLEFHNDTLYESVGEYGESALLKTNLQSGKILKRIDLDKTYFAEGLTILNEKLIQLTWREKTGFIYDLNSFSKTGSFQYGQSKEGWGLCNDGQNIYKSDGTEKIWILDPETYAETGYFEVVDNKKVRSKFNELEWVEGKIYANSYQFDSITIINPETGAIEGVVDLRSLKKEIKSIADDANEVLNGIAYDAASQKLYVTGKHWDKLFEIRILKK
ncbi:glutaminyl-peptide cyclotransferase [Leeuwenhoekiella nanhaiensis]|uniref:Glutamine cyclotransferase n=1 Tax=Leeuwenhoekiella nanhaiensis TaxID=1655491 RepID=A0A2G1VRQ8_9FLAO|nr:glutaminyl-peptide cyclotransferase [Leeuwenhoekiella nanhaiensis]PHQ29139.1 glutamine cyclotransferase [Leeuwenhoekiella nanhaiensis]